MFAIFFSHYQNYTQKIALMNNDKPGNFACQEKKEKSSKIQKKIGDDLKNMMNEPVPKPRFSLFFVFFSRPIKAKRRVNPMYIIV
jgi:hypothetical protein